jgi:phosphatidylglycerophosphate synthase
LISLNSFFIIQPALIDINSPICYYTQMQKTDETTNYNYENAKKPTSNSLLNKFVKINKYINNPIASLIVRAVFKTKITPNQLTFSSFVLGLTGAFFLFLGEPGYFIVGGVLAQLSMIIDCSDGMLARAKGMGSHYGAYLDLFLDRIVDFSLLLGISFGQFYLTNNFKLLIISIITTALFSLQVNLYYLYNALKKNEKKGETGEARALFMLLILIFGIINRLDILIYILFVETIINILFRIIKFIRTGTKQTMYLS